MKRYSGKNSYKALLGKVAALPFLASGFFIYSYLSEHPDMAEEKYSREIYPAIISSWGRLTSKFSFSAAEIVVYVLALLVIARLFRGFVRILRERTAAGRMYHLLDLALSGAVFATALCFLFITLWGLNYNRLPFAETSGLKTAPVSAKVLETSCRLLAEQTNELREETREGDDGVMALSVPLRNTFGRARDGYKTAAAEFETLGGIDPGQAKPVLSSKFMSYAGITGVYFPMTAEANVNTDVGAAEIPFTICHELAHRLGYAREDEANFISWIACSNSPYEDFRYSGAIMALTHLLNALKEIDSAAWGRIRGSCSPAVNRDLNAMGQYWLLYEGPVSDISETINDRFLKANKQEDGVQSYGRMVDLVIAYLRAHGMSAG